MRAGLPIWHCQTGQRKSRPHTSDPCTQVRHCVSQPVQRGHAEGAETCETCAAVQLQPWELREWPGQSLWHCPPQLYSPLFVCGGYLIFIWGKLQATVHTRCHGTKNPDNTANNAPRYGTATYAATNGTHASPTLSRFQRQSRSQRGDFVILCVVRSRARVGRRRGPPLWSRFELTTHELSSWAVSETKSKLGDPLRN